MSIRVVRVTVFPHIVEPTRVEDKVLHIRSSRSELLAYTYFPKSDRYKTLSPICYGDANRYYYIKGCIVLCQVFLERGNHGRVVSIH